MKKNSLLFLLYFCWFAPIPIQAQTSLTVSPSFLYFDYTEFSVNNDFLNNESGWLPGLSINLNSELNNDWSAGVLADYYQGEVDYRGQTQAGKVHTTTTDTRFLRFGLAVKKQINKQVKLFSGVTLHQWNRDINDRNGVSGIDEKYVWQEYSLGMDGVLWVSGKNTFDADIAYLLIKNGRMDVDISSVNYGSTTLNLGDGSGARFRLNWQRWVQNDMHYGLSFFIESWEFGRSNTRMTKGGEVSVAITEPRSETKNMGVKFNVVFGF